MYPFHLFNVYYSRQARQERSKWPPLYVADYRRALHRFLKVKEWIDSGALGYR